MAIKLLIGGSPCTYWSIAQTNNRETKAEGMGWELFKNYLIAKEKFKPDFFLYENNKSAAQAIKDQIAEELGVGVDPDVRFTYINSALVSAQNRQRFYVTNFGDIEQPEDRGILLKDILETGCTDRGKSHAVISSAGRTTTREYFDKQQGTMSSKPVGTTQDGKAQCVRSTCYKDGIRNLVGNDYDQRTCVAEPVVTSEMTPPCDPHGRDKSRTLTAGYQTCSQRDLRMDIESDGFMGKQGIVEPLYIGAVPENKGTYLNGKQPSQQYRIYDTNHKGVAVTTAAITNVAEPVCHIIPQEVRVRKYTCDIGSFQTLLRDSKAKSKLTNKQIANHLGRALTEVEHWFRTDKCFSIPDAEVWFNLKNLLNIETTEFDDFVTVFEEREGVFEKAQRCYDINGKMSTLMTSSNDNIIEPLRVGCMPSPDGEIKNGQAKRIYDIEGKSVNLTANGGGEGAKTGLYAIRVDEPMRVTEATKQGYVDINVGDCVDLTQPNSKTRRGRSLTDKANCLTTSNNFYEYCGVLGYVTPCEWDENGKPIKAVSCADGKTYTVYEVIDGQITIKGKQYLIKLVDGYYIIRKLTVRECARLQTMPDDYCKAVSDSQAYKALGNGWTAEVIIHLLNHALKDVPRDEEIIVLSMYDGIATGRYCLDKMGFTNVKYHAYEIDKYPIQVAMDNYPDIIQHGDAFAVREDDWKPPQTRSEWLDELLGA